MRKNVLLTLTSFFLLSTTVFADESTHTIVDFNWDESTWQTQAAPWSLVPADTKGCGGDTLSMDRLCSDKHRLFLYYSGYDSNHRGWMRYGFMGSSSEYAIEGNALKLTFTGGRATNPLGVAQDYGSVITSKADFDAAQKTLGDDLYAKRDLPASPSLYYKPISNYETTLGLFPNANRFSSYVWMPPIDNRHTRYSRFDRNISAPAKTVAWYPFIDTPKGGHYYHHVSNRPSGGWIKVEFDGHPTHSNAGGYNETHSYPQGGTHAPGNSLDYFSRIASFAYRLHGLANSMSPTTAYIDEWQSSLALYENEETIANVGLGFDPVSLSFDISFEDKYRCGSCQASYELRYSFEPINNGNFNDAHQFERVENFFIEDDNSENLLHKPNPYYNMIWGKVFMPKSMLNRYLGGDRLYVALRDVSNRTFSYDERDDEVFNTPNGDIAMSRLVKVIDMVYHPTPTSSNYHAPEVIYADLQATGEFLFSYEGASSDQEVKAHAPYELRAQVFESKEHHTLLLDPFETGEFDLVLSGKDQAGMTTNKPVLVKVGAPLCGINATCQFYRLADFSQDTVLLHDEFNRIYHDVYTKDKPQGIGIAIGQNPQYNYQGIAGKGIDPQSDDVISITLINIDDIAHDAQPSISSTVESRPSSTGKEAWLQLPEKRIEPGKIARWLIPAQMISTEHMPRLTVSIGAHSQDVLLQSISIHTQAAMSCSNCGEVLIDFYADEENHLTPQKGWTTTLQDRYTSHVGSGSGIVIGSNGNYNFQGIKGDTPLSDQFSILTLHWHNYGTTEMSFSPRYSYDDIDREGVGAEGTWHQAGTLTIPAGEMATQTIPMDKNALLINVRVNKSQQKVLSLDKITGQ